MVRKFRALAIAASCAAAIALSAPAQAQLVYLGTWSGNDCGGQGGFSNCYATQVGTQQGAPTNPLLLGSPSVYKLDSVEDLPTGAQAFSSLFTTITGGEFNITYTDTEATPNNLSFTYNRGVGDPFLHYVAVKQANGYALFYDPNPITSGSFDLDTWWPNNPGWSHITFFDSNTPPVPEPGTWAMMLLGFLGIGTAVRRRRKANGGLLQIA